MILSDATGKSYGAKVDSNNELRTNARMRARFAVATEEGRMFICGTPLLNIGPTTGRVFWLRNDSGTLQYNIHRMLFSWNGGTTSRNKMMALTGYRGDSEPTANNTAVTPTNAYLGSLETVDATAYYWDGVGTGMTVVTPGVTTIQLQFAQGAYNFEWTGTIVLGPQQALSLDLVGEEAGVGSFAMFGYITNPEEEAGTI